MKRFGTSSPRFDSNSDTSPFQPIAQEKSLLILEIVIFLRLLSRLAFWLCNRLSRRFGSIISTRRMVVIFLSTAKWITSNLTDPCTTTTSASRTGSDFISSARPASPCSSFLGYDDSRSALTKAPTFYVSGIAKEFSSPEALLLAEQLMLVEHLESASRHNTII